MKKIIFGKILFIIFAHKYMLIIVGQQLDQIGGFFLRKNMGVTWGEKVLLFLEGFLFHGQCRALQLVKYKIIPCVSSCQAFIVLLDTPNNKLLSSEKQQLVTYRSNPENVKKYYLFFFNSNLYLSIYIYKVVIFVCLFKCMINSETP